MVNTRQSSRLARTERPELTDSELDTRLEGCDLPVDEGPLSALGTHVSGIVRASQALKRDYRQLQRNCEKLTYELVDIKEQLDEERYLKRGNKGKGPDVSQLQRQIVQLKARVKELEKTRARDRRKIVKLEAKEVKRDAEELLDQAEFEVGDSGHTMRKLLRKYHDLMLANSLNESEECPICMTTMEVGQAASLPCQHVFCNDCIRQVASATTDEEHVFRCPSCRERATLGEVETVVYTSSMQWDALLEVANASAKLDRRRGEIDTSDEEAEEYAANNFIAGENEESENSTTTVSDVDPEPEVDGEQASTQTPPLPNGSLRRSKRTIRPPKYDEPISRRTFYLDSSDLSPSMRYAVDGNASDSSLTSLDEEAKEIDGGVLQPSTSHSSQPSTPSYLQSPASEKRRRLTELADARQAKDKRRRFG